MDMFDYSYFYDPHSYLHVSICLGFHGISSGTDTNNDQCGEFGGSMGWFIEWGYQRSYRLCPHMAVCQNLVPRVNIKMAGKWMFIPLKMALIGIDPEPY